MRYIKITAFFIFLSFLISFSAVNLIAASEKDDISHLKQKISELENRIKDLETMLKISREPGEKKAENGDGWWNKKTWRKLKEGMSQEQVKKILGEPVKTIKGRRVIWYYPNFYRGFVSFDENGNLTGWNAP